MKDIIGVLKADGVIVFPTDTVWGVGCLISSEVAIKKLYKIKSREAEKPTGIFIRDIEMATTYGQLNSQARQLAQDYWPGALSIVTQATDKVPVSIQGPHNTVSLRLPNHPQLLKLLSSLEEPLVQTSANFAGKNPPNAFEEINPEFLGLVDGILEGKASQNLPSTIVDTSQAELQVLRQGPIHIE